MKDLIRKSLAWKILTTTKISWNLVKKKSTKRMIKMI